MCKGSKDQNWQMLAIFVFRGLHKNALSRSTYVRFYEISKLYNNTISMGDVTIRNQLLFCVDLKCIILKKKKAGLDIFTNIHVHM